MAAPCNGSRDDIFHATSYCKHRNIVLAGKMTSNCPSIETNVQSVWPWLPCSTKVRYILCPRPSQSYSTVSGTWVVHSPWSAPRHTTNTACQQARGRRRWPGSLSPPTQLPRRSGQLRPTGSSSRTCWPRCRRQSAALGPSFSELNVGRALPLQIFPQPFDKPHETITAN